MHVVSVSETFWSRFVKILQSVLKILSEHVNVTEGQTD